MSPSVVEMFACVIGRPATKVWCGRESVSRREEVAAVVLEGEAAALRRAAAVESARDERSLILCEGSALMEASG